MTVPTWDRENRQSYGLFVNFCRLMRAKRLLLIATSPSLGRSLTTCGVESTSTPRLGPTADAAGHEMPWDIPLEPINDFQTAELKRLTEQLYRQRTRARKEGARAGRQQETAKRKVEPSALFPF